MLKARLSTVSFVFILLLAQQQRSFFVLFCFFLRTVFAVVIVSKRVKTAYLIRTTERDNGALLAATP